MSYSQLIVTLVLVLVAIYAVVTVGWRWASRRFLLPCPSWLSWSLQGGFVDWWAATQRTLDRIGLAPAIAFWKSVPGLADC